MKKILQGCIAKIEQAGRWKYKEDKAIKHKE